MADIFELFQKISKKEEPSGAPEWIIAGLGNPGREYDRTRHNAGFLAMDALTASLGTDCLRARFHSLTGTAVLAGHRVLLLKPQTFMNLSGEAVREAAEFYHIPSERVLVLVDDVYLDAGRMRIRSGGSGGGHNGLGNIICQLNSDRFPRVRIGVGEKPNPEYDMKDWVLGKMAEGDWKRFTACLADVPAACSLILEGKTETAMGQFNGKVYGA